MVEGWYRDAYGGVGNVSGRVEGWDGEVGWGRGRVAPWYRHYGDINGYGKPLLFGEWGGQSTLEGVGWEGCWVVDVALKAEQMEETMLFAEETEFVPVSIIFISWVLVVGESHAVSSA